MYEGRGLGTLRGIDADPPAVIVSVTLTNAENDPQAGMVAYGFTLRLRVQHPGVLHLGFSPPPTTTDAGTPSTDDGTANDASPVEPRPSGAGPVADSVTHRSQSAFSAA